MSARLCLMLLCVALPLPLLGATGVLVCHFDSPDLAATTNDFGTTAPEVSEYGATEAGGGCPADPGGRALDCGYSTGPGRYLMPISSDTPLGQGTLEFWVRPAWDFGDRAIRNLVTIPMHGGTWNSVGVCYHGLMGPETEVFESNIMDGLDHPLAVVTGPDTLLWRKGEWHHVALTWTEHSQRLFCDGKLVGSATYKEPLYFTPPVGKVYVGCSYTGLGDIAAAQFDELRLCTVSLHAGKDSIEVPTERLPDGLPQGLALAAEGAVCSADSEAPKLHREADEPALHDGVYGVTSRIGKMPTTGDATIALASEETVCGITWSRDGRVLSEQGWAWADSLPRDFCVEVSTDGTQWREVARVERFMIDPAKLAQMTAARFPVGFEPTAARYVRLRMTGDTTANLGQWPLLDEITVQRGDGTDAAIMAVTTERTRFTRQYSAAKAIDGWIGEESCWKSAAAGKGELTITLPAMRELSSITWSRSREGLDSDGVPSDVSVSVSEDGAQFVQVARAEALDGPKLQTLQFAPCRAKVVRLTITATADGKEPVIDEIQVR